MAGGAIHGSGFGILLRGSAVRAELRAGWILGSAFRTRYRLRLGGSRSLRVGAADCSGHHLSEAQAESETHSLARSAAFLLGRVGNRLRRFELHIGVHVADRAHARALVDHLLNFFGGSDRGDDEVDKLEPLLRKVIGYPRFHAGGKLIVEGGKIEDGLEVFTEQVVEPGYDNVPQKGTDRFGGYDSPRADDRAGEQLRIGDSHRVFAERPQSYHSKLGVAKSDRLLGPPFQILKGVPRDKQDACLERRRAAERNR